MDSSVSGRKFRGRKLLIIVLLIFFIVFVTLYFVVGNKSTSNKLYSNDNYSIEYPSNLEPEVLDNDLTVFKTSSKNGEGAVVGMTATRTLAQGSFASFDTLANSLSKNKDGTLKKNKTISKATINNREYLFDCISPKNNIGKSCKAYVFDSNNVFILGFTLNNSESSIEEIIIPIIETFQIK